MIRRLSLPVCLSICLALAAGCELERLGDLAGVLVVGQTAEPRSLDPHTVTEADDFRVAVNLYEGLVRFAPDSFEIEPALAVRWEISEDGLLYRFELREDVRFHDGSAFDAAAVVFNFERMLDAGHPYHQTGPFPLAFFFSAVEEVRALATHEVELRLSEPFAPLLANLAYPAGLMVSPQAVREHASGFGRRPSGTGPYRFVDWHPARRILLERNPDYWGEPAAMGELLFRPIDDVNARSTEMFAGGLDVLLEPTPDLAAVFRERPGFAVHTVDGAHVWYLMLNLRDGPLRDERVRRAVNYALDKRALVERILDGAARVSNGPVPAAFGAAHADDLEPYPYDPARARALLEEAGALGSRIALHIPEGGAGMLDPVALATAIQADLAAVGLDVRLQRHEWNSYLVRINQGLDADIDMAAMAWMTNDPDTLPYLTLRSDAMPEHGGFNSGYYANPEVDRLLERARVTPDADERNELYRRVQHLVHADAPWLFVLNAAAQAVTRDSVHGPLLHPAFLLRLEAVEKR